MSTVISIPDKRTIAIPGGGVNGSYHTQDFLGQTEFRLGDWDGRCTVHVQWRFVNDKDEANWPAWLEVQCVRDGEDPTGTETIACPPKRSWGHNTTLEMAVDPTKPLSIQVRHNGKAPVDRVKGILKIAPKVTEVVAR